MSGIAEINNTKVPEGHTLLSWGCGEFGQHGHPSIKNDVSFQQCAIDKNILPGKVRLAACGSSHAIVVTEDGEIYSWGNGNSGQLGRSDISNRIRPERLNLDPKPPDGVTVSSVACGSRHTMLVLSNGQVYACGNNFYAQLGYDFKKETYKENQKKPLLLRFLVHNPVSAVACGDKHTMFLFKSGNVSVVGHNSHGQVGDNSRCESVVPKPVDLDFRVTQIASGCYHNMVISDKGDVYVWGYCKPCGHRCHDVLKPELKLEGKKAVQVAGGRTHSMALTVTGDVYCWGFGTDGQLGMGEKRLTSSMPRLLRDDRLRHSVSFVSCAQTFSAAVTNKGQLYMWGKNSHVISPTHQSSHKFYSPVLMNEDLPSSSVHSVACGAWHAVALGGTPDVQPAVDEDLTESDECGSDDGMTSGESDALSRSDSAAQKLDENGEDIEYFAEGGPNETSAPPSGHKTRNTSFLGFEGLPARGQTKLTLGEFYAMTDSSPSLNDSPRSVSTKKTDKQGQTTPESPRKVEPGRDSQKTRPSR